MALISMPHDNRFTRTAQCLCVVGAVVGAMDPRMQRAEAEIPGPIDVYGASTTDEDSIFAFGSIS